MDSAIAHPGMLIADRYRLQEEIGHGGFSQVFRAVEVRLEKEVALKVLSKDGVDEAGHARFRREAELARRLEHPNTVRLLDFELDAKPAPFIAYELLNGEPLLELVKRGGPMPAERVARLVAQVLKSLMEAHAAGIVHRDIKPGNVFICTYAGEPDFVKVLDFGIAKTTAPGDKLTAAGMMVGTPRYMPPDQIRGEPPVASMDLYAVGMMMAEMLTGRPVLRGTPVEAAMDQLRAERIALPEAVERSALAPVIRRATEKDTSLRYATAAEMLADLERVRPGLAAQGGAAPFGEVEPELPSGQVPTHVMEVPRLPAETLYAPLEVPPVAAAPKRSSSVAWTALAVALVLVALAGVVALVLALRWRMATSTSPVEPAATAASER